MRKGQQGSFSGGVGVDLIQIDEPFPEIIGHAGFGKRTDAQLFINSRNESLDLLFMDPQFIFFLHGPCYDELIIY